MLPRPNSLTPYCTVVEASNGQEALDLAIKTKPNVVLSDVMMPSVRVNSLVSVLALTRP